MRHILFVIGLLVLFTSIVSSQTKDMYMLEAHALSYDKSEWVLLDPPVKIVITKDEIAVYSKQTQIYKVINHINSINNDTELSHTWLCVNAQGIRVWVTLGIMKSDEYGQYVYVQYSDHKWIYRCYVKEQ